MGLGYKKIEKVAKKVTKGGFLNSLVEKQMEEGRRLLRALVANEGEQMIKDKINEMDWDKIIKEKVKKE